MHKYLLMYLWLHTFVVLSHFYIIFIRFQAYFCLFGSVYSLHNDSLHLIKLPNLTDLTCGASFIVVMRLQLIYFWTVLAWYDWHMVKSDVSWTIYVCCNVRGRWSKFSWSYMIHRPPTVLWLTSNIICITNSELNHNTHLSNVNMTKKKKRGNHLCLMGNNL